MVHRHPRCPWVSRDWSTIARTPIAGPCSSPVIVGGAWLVSVVSSFCRVGVGFGEKPFQLRQSSFGGVENLRGLIAASLAFFSSARISSQRQVLSGLQLRHCGRGTVSVPLRPSLAPLGIERGASGFFHSSLFFLARIFERFGAEDSVQGDKRASTTAREDFAPRVAARQWPGCWSPAKYLRKPARICGSRKVVAPPGEG